ncbi:hypothetical protein ACJJIW_05265 [Microbulbifer sp. JMSA004]|uniref:hypothetical protein n=1 Tax=unclassified Microbulbifer TaxID=2619833 RepID=UPI0024ADD193|nr:hypothetical protein [Microbulbifer sp. VAAF005]WHI44633.1 hypothetical protein P0078_12830 [Microbulbifer sp. VAAF005]
MKKPILHALCIWALVYPIVTLLLLGMQALELQIAIGLKALIMTAILVPLMYFYLVPKVHQFLARH